MQTTVVNQQSIFHNNKIEDKKKLLNPLTWQWLSSALLAGMTSVDLQASSWISKYDIAVIAVGFFAGMATKSLLLEMKIAPKYLTAAVTANNLLHSFWGVGLINVKVSNAFNAGVVLADYWDNSGTQKGQTEEVRFKLKGPLETKTSLFSSIMERLNKNVIGQTKAKESLASAIATHYQRFLSGPLESSSLGKGNILLIGPSGTGKTLMAQLCCEALGVPMAFIDGSRIVPEGIEGQKLGSIYQELYKKSGQNLALAEHGIIFIDEVDKLFDASKDGSGYNNQSVTNQLLTNLQGTNIKFKEDDSLFSGSKTLNTKNVLFILAGTFNGLTTSSSSRSSPISLDDLSSYGLQTEFIGRLGHVVQLDPLDQEAFKKILFNESSSLSFPTWQKEFKKYGLELTLENGLEDAIIEFAMQLETGVRGLDFALRQVLSKLLIESIENLKDNKIHAEDTVVLTRDYWNKMEFKKQKDKVFPTLTELKNCLNENVVGQQEAKNAVAEAVYLHFSQQSEDLPDSTRFPKGNLLLIGPSGTGKTLMMETLSKKLQIPFASIDASRMTRAGIVGLKPEDAILSLLQQAKGNEKKAEKGIIFLDEIDKVFAASNSAFYAADEGKAVQNQMLRLLEGDSITVTYQKQKKTVNTKNILFVLAGAFSHVSIPSDVKTIENDRLINAGIAPEFLGRVSTISQLKPLNEDELKAALTENRGSLLTPWKNAFARYGVTLNLSETDIDRIVGKAKEKSTGVRGLQFELRKFLSPLLTQIIIEKERNESIILETAV